MTGGGGVNVKEGVGGVISILIGYAERSGISFHLLSPNEDILRVVPSASRNEHI